MPAKGDKGDINCLFHKGLGYLCVSHNLMLH